MDLYPAVDLLGGECVRLFQGSYDKVTTYERDAVDVALGFEASGAEWIHLVDLDGARSGTGANTEVIAEIVGAVKVPVQVGGGIRSLETARQLSDAGVARVVLGTSAVENPDLVRQIAARQPVALGLDLRGTEVAVHGWTVGSGVELLDLLEQYRDCEGIAAIIVTQIARDGTLEGPDLDGLAAVLQASPFGVIASGGVGSIADLGDLRRLRGGSRQLSGVIVGKAIHDGLFTVDDALDACDQRQDSC
ncbi:MAG: 1-(5-phosphoribosyl)-5-[(5-phosphoribosylamino)methylideneamino]imidazole-4-carboxamide isomerase [Acidimicrobiales bacterium]